MTTHQSFRGIIFLLLIITGLCAGGPIGFACMIAAIFQLLLICVSAAKDK